MFWLEKKHKMTVTILNDDARTPTVQTTGGFAPYFNQFNFDCSTGANRWIVVVACWNTSGTFNITDVTYDGNSMGARFLNNNDAAQLFRWSAFKYDVSSAGLTGTNTLRLEFSGAVPSAYSLFTFVAGGMFDIGNIGTQDIPSTPPGGSTTRSATLDVSAGSTVYAFAIFLNFAINDISIAGSSRTLEFEQNVTKRVAGAFSAPGLVANPATDITITLTNPSFISNNRIELLEAAAAPEIQISTTSLTGFSYVEGSGPSASQLFDVSGTDLTDSVTVSAVGLNYEISDDDISFSDTLILTQTGGSLDGQPVDIYVRLKSGLVPADYNAEDLVLSSPGATDQNVTLSGTVISRAQGGWFMLM
jgi:hypothetical protein